MHTNKKSKKLKTRAKRARKALLRKTSKMDCANLLSKATSVFGDKKVAKEWMKTPQVGLGGDIPFVIAKTVKGCREVKRLLTRIDRGVYA